MTSIPLPRSPSVLVVQRDPELIGLLLKREGFDVRTAADARSALEVAAEQVPEVVLVDWTLPDSGGIDLCRQLKGIEATMQIPTVLMTAHEDDARRATAREAGALALLGKPFSRNQLVTCLLSVLRGNSAPG